jgi:hypothetical protein
MADRTFSLSNIRSGVSRRISELVGPDSDPNAKSFDSRDNIANRPFVIESENYDRIEGPKDDLRKYFRQYETTPMVRKPVLSFASQVIEPGYYIEAPHLPQEERRRLENWLQTCAILEGELGKDWRNLAKKAIIQREVRGTVLIEKVPAKEDPDKLAGFKFINPETIEIVTHPNQSILLEPDAVEYYDNVPTTDEGLAAAYLQDISETGQSRFGTPIEDLYDGESKIAFTRDEIIKFTRDADVGEVFGTSRVETVSERIDGIKQKLVDNDEAIASKAYPLMMFLFGTEENPWERSDIKNFMSAHEIDNFRPGMKQGVRGDVEVETVSGSVADIAGYLQFDIDYIISAMPMPKYALGGFAEAVGQIAGVAQQQDINRQLKEARRELETEFNPVIQEKAEEMGMEKPEQVRIRIGREDQPNTDPDINQNIIRYIGVGNDEQEDEPNASDSSESDSSEQTGTGMENPIESPEDLSETIWDHQSDVAELQQKSANQGMIADTVYDTMEEARNGILERVYTRYQDSRDGAARSYEADANEVVDMSIRSNEIRDDAASAMESELYEIYDEYTDITGSKYTTNLNSSQYASNVEMAARDALDEMMRRIRTQIRRGIESNDTFENMQMRVLETYTDASLRTRAELIAQMEVHRARETTKLQEFERDPSVTGVRVMNDDAHTPLCKSLASHEAYFEAGDIREQLSSNTADEYMHDGFSPLPVTPPYHFNCGTRLEPIYE